MESSKARRRFRAVGCCANSSQAAAAVTNAYSHHNSSMKPIIVSPPSSLLGDEGDAERHPERAKQNLELPVVEHAVRLAARLAGAE